ncbi:MAG: hypothetical protein V4568_07115 [Pseudomonadota bacterium]
MVNFAKQVLTVTSICALVTPLFAQADPVCLSLSGKVRLEPDATCQIIAVNPGPLYLGQLGVPNSCFSVQVISGILSSKGVAGLTSETMISPISGVAQTPAILNEAGIPAVQNELGLPETRRVFTGRSALSLPGGKVFTADAGVLHGEDSTEQLIIIGGTGPYAKASGTIYTSGKVIGQWGNISGQLCYTK